ncbi:hypothetical protein Ait01nite_059870 [Actinoplanes italicus]|uniref:Uncharacterized protein n=1 Tax=Actinoplanes italicus TaxID=113567 RepID=A0A2T0K711_9ACTN|nr:hypothetical protein [Actinoplanes italicus]PRX18604.1 hypothetical protein CLV67_11278 [Actinoplanes italicus]GIE32942.1 hypothetical protein Ait01nite_059870 [Actinoplanes italicus]
MTVSTLLDAGSFRAPLRPASPETGALHDDRAATPPACHDGSYNRLRRAA